MAATPQVAQARRELANLRGFVRRPVEGWVKNRNARWPYERAYRAVVAVEDAEGVEAAAELGDRLRELRWEAERAGLLTPAEVADAERAALEALDV